MYIWIFGDTDNMIFTKPVKEQNTHDVIAFFFTRPLSL